MQDDTSLQAKLSDILMSGVSTRKYERVIPAMAESCGVSKSSVSREFKEASAEKLQELAERRRPPVHGFSQRRLRFRPSLASAGCRLPSAWWQGKRVKVA